MRNQVVMGQPYRERYPTLYKWGKRALEAIIVVSVSYELGVAGIRIIVGGNGLFLWSFWFGSVYSFVLSDWATVLLERRAEKYTRWPLLRIGFYLLGLYASSELTLAYSVTFDEFISNQSAVQWVGWVVLGLSAGALLIPYSYFRWKYKDKPAEHDPVVVLEGL
jgi:hypothetical protein